MQALLRGAAGGGAIVALLHLMAGAAVAAEPQDPCAALGEAWWPIDGDAEREQRFAVVDGRSFYRTPREITAFRLSLDLQRIARDDCPRDDVPGAPGLPGVPDVPRWHPVLRLSSANAPLQPVDDTGEVIARIRGEIPHAALATVTVAEVQTAIDRAHVTADPAAAAFVFHYLTSSDRDATLARARSELSMAQMVAAAQYFGYLAGQRYDYNKGPSVHRRVVSSAAVTDAAAAELTGGDPYLTAGNCSDVANAQGELLQKLGAKDVVVATTAHILGLHSTVVARDPHSQTYYQLNFGAMTRSSRREGADLFHVPGDDSSWADVGPGVYLNRPNGRTLGYVPTNAGKVYAEAAGMDIAEIEPLARATSSLLGAQLALPHGQSLQTFTARDPSGSYYAGVALTQSWAQGTHFPGAAGLVTAWRRAPEGLNVADFYLQIDQHAVSPALALGRILRARLDGGLIVIGTYALPFSDVQGRALGADAALLVNCGAELTAGSAASPISGRLRVAAQIAPGLTNIAAATPTVFLNHLVVSADGRVRLNARGDLQLTAGSAVLYDSFGPRVTAGVGLESRYVAVRLEAWGRVLESDPTYKEGSLRRGRAAVAVPVARWLRISTLTEVQEGGTDAKWTQSGVLEGRF